MEFYVGFEAWVVDLDAKLFGIGGKRWELGDAEEVWDLEFGAGGRNLKGWCGGRWFCID